MRIRKLYLLIAALVALLFGGTACQTAQRPASLLPAGKSTAPALKASSAPAPQSTAGSKTVPAPKTQSEAKLDPVAELIAQVEKEYKLGQDNYRAGHLESAKENFDRAFNLLLGSSLDVRT